MSNLELSTEVPEIVVQVDEQGHFRLYNNRTEQHSEWTHYRGIGLLRVPDELKPEFGPNAYFMWLTQFHEGVLPTETLMITHTYDPVAATQLESVPEEQVEAAEEAKARAAIWVGRVTKPFYSPGAMNPNLNVGQFMLFTSNEPDYMYDSLGICWNAYATDVVPTQIKYEDLGWTWLEHMTAAEIVEHCNS